VYAVGDARGRPRRASDGARTEPVSLVIRGADFDNDSAFMNDVVALRLLPFRFRMRTTYRLFFFKICF
jgi:hypothetical protein